MSTEHNGAGIEAGAATTRVSGVVRLGDKEVRVERLSGLKLSRALATVRAAGQAVPAIIERWGTFQSEYQASHSLELDRAAALMRYGPVPLTDITGEPVIGDDGQPRMMPGRLAHLTDADWSARGNVLRIPVSPSTAESVAAILPEVLELAEEHVYTLVALLAMPNAEVVRYWKSGELPKRLSDYADELLEAPADDLLELAVVAGEVLDDQFRRKTAALGDRLGNALRLFGLDPASFRAPKSQTTSQDEPSTPSSSNSSPTSSTDSPASTDGSPTSPSERPPTSSTPSATASDETENSKSDSEPKPTSELATA